MERISVITICFNNLADLKASCSSVEKQTVLPFEHIIIDGSTNGEIAKWLNETKQPDYRKWITERDKGISDAFNKGIRYASGSVIHLLNSGDTYYDDAVLRRVTDAFHNEMSITWVSGRILMKRGGIWVHVGVPFDAGQLYKGMRAVSHPTYFLRKEVYDRVGLFSDEYKIAMDYDLLCRLSNEPYVYIAETLIRFDDKGISGSSYLKSLKENVQVYESNFGFSLKCRLWQFRLRLLYYLMQSSVGKMLYRIKMNFSK